MTGTNDGTWAAPRCNGGAFGPLGAVAGPKAEAGEADGTSSTAGSDDIDSASASDSASAESE